MRLAIVLNSSAGTLVGQDTDAIIARLRDAFTTAGHAVECVCVPGSGVSAAIAKAARSDAELLLVGGGDGTIKTGAKAALDSGKALGILPLGTMNLLARDLAIPLELEAAIDALGSGEMAAMDVAYLNDEPFLNNAVIGLYARMVHERERMRRQRGWRKWPAMGWALVKTIADNRQLAVTLTLDDGRVQHLRTPMLAVANNEYVGGYGPVPHRERLDAGHLTLYIGRHRTRWQLVRLFLRAITSTWHHDPDLIVHKVRAASVHAGGRKLRVALDGELERRATPLDFRIEPGRLRIWRPQVADRTEAAARERTG